jgi:hypothetical protein
MLAGEKLFQKTRRLHRWFYLRQEVPGVFSSGNIMKFRYFSLFGAKGNGETPEPLLFSDQSQDHSVSERRMLIPLRSPSDQLQIVVFPAIII